MIDTNISLEKLNNRSLLNMGQHLGIEFTDIQSNCLLARMPVDQRTRQPLGMLNGGASACLAETTGSMAAYLSIDRSQYYCLGLEIKCNHLRPIFDGFVYAKATSMHEGRKTHLWQIELRDEPGNLTAFATLTMAVLELTDDMKHRYKDLFLEN